MLEIIKNKIALQGRNLQGHFKAEINQVVVPTSLPGCCYKYTKITEQANHILPAVVLFS
jgi:hypothetical protein